MSVSESKLKELIRSGLKEVIAEQKNTETRPQERTPEEARDQIADHFCECPDCFCGAIERMNQISDYACSDCGLPLGKETAVKEIEKCPNCGSKRAPKKIER